MLTKPRRRAARRAEIRVREHAPAVDVHQGMARGSEVMPPYGFGRGDAPAALDAAPHAIREELHVGGQDHFYLEGQVALAVPGEEGAMSAVEHGASLAAF